MVLLGPFDADVLAHHGIGQALLTALTEWLVLLRGVDAGQPDLVLDLVASSTVTVSPSVTPTTLPSSTLTTGRRC